MKRLLTMMVLVTLLAGTLNTAAQQSNQSVTFRFVNLTAEPIDLYRDGEIVFFGTESEGVSAERVLNNPGTYEFQIYEINGNRAEDDPFDEGDFEFAGGDYQLLVAYETADGIALAAFELPLFDVLTHRSRLNVINVSANTIDVVGQNQDTLVAGLAVNETVFADVPSGNYQAQILDADGTALGEAAIDLSGLQDSLARAETLIVFGIDDVQSISISNTVGQQALFRFVHAARISPAMDVYVDGVLVASNIAYLEATEYLAFPTGSYSVELFETGGLDNLLWNGIVELTTTFPRTGVALGEANLRLLTYADDLQQIPAERARVRFINAAQNLLSMSVLDTAGNPLVGGLEYALGSPNQNIPTDPQTLAFRETGVETYVTLEGFGFDRNTVYTFIVVGNIFIADETEVVVLTWNWQTN